MKGLQERFNKFICNHSVYHYYYYKERWFDLKGKYDNNKFQCNKCINNSNKNTIKVFNLSAQYNLDPKIELMYYLLPELNDIEEMFIACIHIVMKVFQIGNRNISYKGNIFNIE